MKIEQLNPELFTWEKFIGRMGFSQLDVVTPDFKQWRPDVTVLGYCDAGRLTVRPRPGEFAVMVEFNDTHEQCWLHINGTFWPYLSGQQKTEEKC